MINLIAAPTEFVTNHLRAALVAAGAVALVLLAVHLWRHVGGRVFGQGLAARAAYSRTNAGHGPEGELDVARSELDYDQGDTREDAG